MLNRLVADVLRKANAQKGAEKAGHKYLRRVPDGKGGWRYYYTASSLGRAPQEGEELQLDGRKVKVHAVDDEKVTVQHEDGHQEQIAHEDWHRRMTWQYGDKYLKASEQRARQWAGAVLKHVPRELLADLKGATDAERLADLKQRAPDIHAKLEPALKRAGVSAFTARSAIVWALQRKGWTADARASLLGACLDPQSAWALRNYREISAAAERLAVPVGGTVSAMRPGVGVDAEHVGAAVRLFERKAANAATRKQLGDAQKALDAARKSKDPKRAAEALAALLQSPDIAELLALARGYPQTLKTEPAVAQARDLSLQSAGLVHPDEPVRDGAGTNFYVAGEDGKPVALPARYKLVEAGDVTPSHDPISFSRHEAYPEGLQERAYHRDKSEQAKVINNARDIRPDFTINTNPDATNGPPVVDAKGIVLGGNSRIMSLQRAWGEGAESAEKYRGYLTANAHQFGLRPSDVAAMQRPVLVREVDTTGHDPKLLVRQMNETFMQTMDPRTMQVAMGRRVSSQALEALGRSMAEDEGLSEFLDSTRSRGFLSALQDSGIIDRRNANQYLTPGGKFNEDGKTLVSRILVGRMVDDADMLSTTPPSVVNALARAVPYMVQAESAGEGYGIRDDLKTALDAYNQIRGLNYLPGDKDVKKGQTHVTRVTNDAVAQLKDLFRHPELDGNHPVTASPRARALLDVLIQKPGQIQASNVFKEYARLAKLNPVGQGTMFGSASPDDVFHQSIKAATDKEARAAAAAAGPAASVSQLGGLDMFAGTSMPPPEEPKSASGGMFAGVVAASRSAAAAPAATPPATRGELVPRRALDRGNDGYEHTWVKNGRERHRVDTTAADRLHDLKHEYPDGVPADRLASTLLLHMGDLDSVKEYMHASGFDADEISAVAEANKPVEAAVAKLKAGDYSPETQTAYGQAQDDRDAALAQIVQKRGYKVALDKDKNARQARSLVGAS